ncbi:MAG: DinB family protein [Flavobacteriaceae bacterium]|jgi:hypothetical protein|nr:DinB family protein [Flavobacteriaceae bacterium]
MRSNKSILKDFEGVYEEWLVALDLYSEEQIKGYGADENWSIGQVYMHLIQATLEFQGKQLEVCLEQEDNQSKMKNFRGFMVYKILGKFPPVKIKVAPSSDYTPPAPKSKIDVRERMEKALEMMKLWEKKLDTSKGGKTLHPGFSYLNAQEWYLLILMHWKHHLKQKKALDKVLLY